MKVIKYSIVTFLLVQNLAYAKDIWISDEIQAPLRLKPEINSDISELVGAGEKVRVIQTGKEYVKVRLDSGTEGWLSNYYILNKESVHAKYKKVAAQVDQLKKDLSASRAELAEKSEHLESLTAVLNQKGSELNQSKEFASSSEQTNQELIINNKLLKVKLMDQNKKLTRLAKALEKANERAIDARTSYLSLAKSSDNLVEIDAQNKEMQERLLKLGQDFQLIKNENQVLKSQQVNRERLTGVGIILMGVLIGFFVTNEKNKRSRNSYY